MQKEPENCMTKQESKVDVLNRLRILLMSKQPSGSFNQMWLAPCGLLIARIRNRVPHPRGVVVDRGVPSSVPESLSASPCHIFRIAYQTAIVKPICYIFDYNNAIITNRFVCCVLKSVWERFHRFPILQ